MSQQWTPQPPEQMIKVYKFRWPRSAVSRFRSDAQKLAREGWRVQSQSPLEKVAMFRRGITVVYVRS